MADSPLLVDQTLALLDQLIAKIELSESKGRDLSKPSRIDRQEIARVKKNKKAEEQHKEIHEKYLKTLFAIEDGLNKETEGRFTKLRGRLRALWQENSSVILQKKMGLLLDSSQSLLWEEYQNRYARLCENFFATLNPSQQELWVQYVTASNNPPPFFADTTSDSRREFSDDAEYKPSISLPLVGHPQNLVDLVTSAANALHAKRVPHKTKNFSDTMASYISPESYNCYIDEDAKRIRLDLDEKDFTLQELRQFIDTTVRQELSNPERWKRIKDSRGVGYCIKLPFPMPTEDILNQVISDEYLHRFSKTDIEYYSEDLNGQRKIPDPNIQTASDQPVIMVNIIRGNAAKQILGQLGVDMHKIKDAPGLRR